MDGLIRNMPLQPGRIGDRYDPGLEGLIAPSRGWQVELRAKHSAAELACAHQRSMIPTGMKHSWYDDCRISILRGNHVMADYFPAIGHQVEFPDGGAIHPLPGLGVELVGSALALGMREKSGQEQGDRQEGPGGVPAPPSR